MAWEPTPSATDPGLDRAWYGIGFGAAYVRFWKKYATFSGRASRGEFWWAFLANTIVVCVLYAIFMSVATTTQTCDEYSCSAISPVGNALGILVAVYCLAMFVPTFAIIWRRLHDTGRSGAWFWIRVVPFGEFVLLVFLVSRPSLDGARYDPVGYGPYAPQPYDQPTYDQPYRP